MKGESMAAVYTTGGNAVESKRPLEEDAKQSRPLTWAEAEESAKRRNAKAEKLGISTRYEVR